MPARKNNSLPNHASTELFPGVDAYTSAMVIMPMTFLQIMADVSHSMSRMPAEAFVPTPLLPSVTGLDEVLQDEVFQPRPLAGIAIEPGKPERDILVLKDSTQRHDGVDAFPADADSYATRVAA
jgi:hypothetical protein